MLESWILFFRLKCMSVMMMFESVSIMIVICGRMSLLKVFFCWFFGVVGKLILLFWVIV